jgi:hypothetical protein
MHLIAFARCSRSILFLRRTMAEHRSLACCSAYLPLIISIHANLAVIKTKPTKVHCSTARLSGKTALSISKCHYNEEKQPKAPDLISQINASTPSFSFTFACCAIETEEEAEGEDDDNNDADLKTDLFDSAVQKSSSQNLDHIIQQ